MLEYADSRGDSPMTVQRNVRRKRSTRGSLGAADGGFFLTGGGEAKASDEEEDDAFVRRPVERRGGRRVATRPAHSQHTHSTRSRSLGLPVQSHRPRADHVWTPDMPHIVDIMDIHLPSGHRRRPRTSGAAGRVSLPPPDRKVHSPGSTCSIADVL